jgi:hypothetical protein
MHHNMCDCMWAHWNIDLNNANTNDPARVNFAINDFGDENSNPVSVEAGLTVLYPLLTYQFEPCSLAGGQVGKGQLTGKQLEEFLKAGAPNTITNSLMCCGSCVRRCGAIGWWKARNTRRGNCCARFQGSARSGRRWRSR